MKKLLFLIVILGFISGIALATSVTTQDGLNYSVTNDSGFSTNMTANQIQQKVDTSSTIGQQDSVKFLADQETADVWGQVQQMSAAAYTNWLSMQQLANQQTNWADNQVNGS